MSETKSKKASQSLKQLIRQTRVNRHSNPLESVTQLEEQIDKLEQKLLDNIELKSLKKQLEQEMDKQRKLEQARLKEQRDLLALLEIEVLTPKLEKRIKKFLGVDSSND